MKKIYSLLISSLAFCSPVFSDYYVSEVDPITDRKVISTGIVANETKKNQLLVKCDGKKVTIIIGTDDVLDSRFTVAIRWDDNPAEEYWVNSNKSFNAFFLKSAKKFIKKFKEHDSMLIRYSDYRGVSNTVSFNLYRFRFSHLERAESEGCNFK